MSAVNAAVGSSPSYLNTTEVLMKSLDDALSDNCLELALGAAIAGSLLVPLMGWLPLNSMFLGLILAAGTLRRLRCELE